MKLFSTLPNDGDEVCFLELLQVLCHGLACHVHVLTECHERLAVLPMQQVKQMPAARVSQRFEDFVDVQLFDPASSRPSSVMLSQAGYPP